MEGTGKLEGYDEILKVYELIGDDKLMNNMLKEANKEAVKPVQKQLKGLPYGRLSKKIAIRATGVGGNKHPNAVTVGPTSDVFQIRFVDKGTKERYTKKGAYRGKIVGKGLIENLIDTASKEVQDNAEKQYAENLIKLTEKHIKKINKKK